MEDDNPDNKLLIAMQQLRNAVEAGFKAELNPLPHETPENNTQKQPPKGFSR